MHAVKIWLIRDADEKLRSTSVRIAATDHGRHGSARIFFRVPLSSQHTESAGAVRLRLRRIFRERIAALDDALSNHSMKDCAVVQTVLRVLDEIPDVVRRRLRE